MENREELKNLSVEIASDASDLETAQRMKKLFGENKAEQDLLLKLDKDGLSLVSDGQVLRGDFTRMLPRLKAGKLSGELLVRAAKIKGKEGPLTAVDATAGLGEDSLLLAAAGFRVILCERNPIVYELLRDAVRRAKELPELAEIVGRMELRHEDSLETMRRLEFIPDVILLDPMFPERQKSALVKKKLQMIQKLELPCMDERELLITAMRARPKKLIVKRPPKGPYLAEIKPDHSITGKAVRFDCFVSPYERIHKFDP